MRSCEILKVKQQKLGKKSNFFYDVDKRSAAGRLLLSANRPSVPNFTCVCPKYACTGTDGRLALRSSRPAAGRLSTSIFLKTEQQQAYQKNVVIYSYTSEIEKGQDSTQVKSFLKIK